MIDGINFNLSRHKKQVSKRYVRVNRIFYTLAIRKDQCGGNTLRYWQTIVAKEFHIVIIIPTN